MGKIGCLDREASEDYFDMLLIKPYLGRFFNGYMSMVQTARLISCSATRTGTAISLTIVEWWAAGLS